MLTTEEIILIITIILIIILLYVNKNKLFNKFENNTDPIPTTTSASELDENGFVKNEFSKNELNPSYWYNYAPSEVRSKCFACDATSKFRHPSNCIDCETKGGRPVDKLLNRVLTR
jgi:hypothetical protein